MPDQARTLNAEQEAWLASFEDLAGYRPLLDDFLDGHVTFKHAAESRLEGYGDYVRDEIRRLECTIPDSNA